VGAGNHGTCPDIGSDPLDLLGCAGHFGTTVFAAMPWPCGYPEAGIVGPVQHQTDHSAEIRADKSTNSHVIN
jgi:hypothetical protein